MTKRYSYLELPGFFIIKLDLKYFKSGFAVFKIFNIKFS